MSVHEQKQGRRRQEVDLADDRGSGLRRGIEGTGQRQACLLAHDHAGHLSSEQDHAQTDADDQADHQLAD